jgi:hypothetical protein
MAMLIAGGVAVIEFVFHEFFKLIDEGIAQLIQVHIIRLKLVLNELLQPKAGVRVFDNGCLGVILPPKLDLKTLPPSQKSPHYSYLYPKSNRHN